VGAYRLVTGQLVLVNATTTAFADFQSLNRNFFPATGANCKSSTNRPTFASAAGTTRGASRKSAASVLANAPRDRMTAGYIISL
jgi:hypothetical protein